MAAFCCIYGLNDGEEAIGSERVVGERKLAPREPYGARRTRLREYPVPLGSPIQQKVAFMATFCCIQGLNDGEEAIGSERVVGERKLAPREPYGARRIRFCGST